MIERTLPAATVRIGLILGALFVVVAGGASGVSAETFTVTSTEDSDEVGTFRWAVTQANSNDGTSSGMVADTIDFALGDSVLADGAVDGFFTIELDQSPTETFEITSELTILAPTDTLGTNYFILIERSGNEPLNVFIARQKLTLVNADLLSEGLIFNGPTVGDEETIDLIYDIRTFNHDVTGKQQEFFFENPPVKDGRIVKTGLGELAYLSNDAEYSGGTVLAGGILRTDTFSLQGDIQLCSNDAGIASKDCGSALLIFEMPSETKDPDADRPDPPTNGTYAGNITGVTVTGAGGDEDAKVVKTGAGTLTLTGVNDYDGGTYVMEGTLAGDAAAIQGPIHLCPGVADLTKPNRSDPTLISCPDLTTQAHLTLDVDSASAFDGTLNGGGLFEKKGNGRLAIEQTQATFAGSLEVSDGELALNSALGNGAANIVDVTVRSGGTLSGTSAGVISGPVTVGSGGRIKGALDLTDDLQLEGTLELGTSTMTGTSATIADGSTIEVLASTAPRTGMLSLSGPLTLERGTVRVEFDPGLVADFVSGSIGAFEKFTIVESTSAVDPEELTGGPNGDGIRFDSAIFDLALSYDDPGCTGTGNVCLTTTFDPVIIDDAKTRNQRQIARAIDAALVCSRDPMSMDCMIGQDTAVDFAELFTNFAIAAADIPNALDQIAGEEYAAIFDLRSAAATRYNRSISRRFDLEFPATQPDDSHDPNANNNGVPVGVERMAFAADAPSRGGYRDYRRNRMSWRRSEPKEPMPMSRHPGKGGWTGWLDIHGVMGELGGSKNTEDVDYRIYGPLYGMDYGVNEHITLGATVGYTRNEMKTPHSVAKATGNTYQGGVYVGAVFDSFHLTGSARYAHSDFETRRSVRFNSIDRTASANVDANDISAFLEAAYHIPMRANILVQPTVSLTFEHMDQDSISERGLDSLDLEIDGAELDTVQTRAGVRIALFGRDGDGRYMLPQLRVAYEREWLDESRAISGNLPSAGSNGEFKINGLSLPRDRGLIGLSSEVGVSDNINVFADYDLRAAKDLLEHSLSFGFRAIW